MEFRHILIERLRQEADLVLVGLNACPRVKTVSSVPSEECVISSRSHRAPSEHTGKAVNSSVRLTGSETKVTNEPTRATVHPCRSGSCRNEPAAASGAATPGSLGPFPFTQCGFGGPSPWCNTHAGKRVPFGNGWQLRLQSLRDCPARGPSRPL